MLLDEYPGSGDDAEIRLATAGAAIELGFLEEAAAVLEPISTEASGAETAAGANMLMAAIDSDKGRYPESAARLMTAMALDPSLSAEARRELAGIVPLLSATQLAALQEHYPAAPGIELVYEGSLMIAEAEGDTASARQLRTQIAALDTMEMAIPPVPGRPVPSAAVVPGGRGEGKASGTIGVLCPLTGRYAPLGREFIRGATVAVREAMEYGVTGVELVVGDTGSSALESRSTALALIEREKVDALVGGVLSSTTIAAAQAAQSAGTVLYSPVASEHGISGIGDHIFQTAQDFETETAAVARIAVTGMKLKKIAFLAEDSPRWRSLADLFSREVEGLGGELVAAEFYEQGSTDFKADIQDIRRAGAEALFIPSDVEDLVLILPQFSFYEFGVQLLGTSTWNSKRLLRMAARDMEGAVFPSEDVSEEEEERYLAAAAMTGFEGADVNRFVVGGYVGVRRTMEAMAAASASGSTLRDEMERMLSKRQHRFIEMMSGDGISFSTVRMERVEEYGTLAAPRR